jgi:hypothetical protein
MGPTEALSKKSLTDIGADSHDSLPPEQKMSASDRHLILLLVLQVRSSNGFRILRSDPCIHEDCRGYHRLLDT